MKFVSFSPGPNSWGLGWVCISIKLQMMLILLASEPYYESLWSVTLTKHRFLCWIPWRVQESSFNEAPGDFMMKLVWDAKLFFEIPFMGKVDFWE